MAWIYKRGGSTHWWIGYRHNGVQVLKSTGTADRAEAQKQLAKVDLMLGAEQAGVLTFEMFQQLTGRALPNLTLAAALDDWLNEARGATGKRTVEKYEGMARALREHFQANEK